MALLCVGQKQRPQEICCRLRGPIAPF